MKYARDYVAERYPNQEVVMVLHRERCRSDGTDRYAVHLGINRSDLETGRRLDEGPARKAAAAPGEDRPRLGREVWDEAA